MIAILTSVRWYVTVVLVCISLWEGLGAGGEGDDREWDGWMASLTWWMWVWVNSGSWWWTGRPGVLRFMGSQRIGQYWVTELNWTEGLAMLSIFSYAFRTSVYLLGKNVSLYLRPISWLGCLFVFILSCVSYLYIWRINPLLIASFANIFFHSVDCLLVLFIVSFVVQKLLSLIWSH